MKRVLFTILVWTVTSSQATAQNKVSQTLSGLSDDQRNETFTYVLRDNNAKCDRVIRTLFSGATVELDDWEALCRMEIRTRLLSHRNQTPVSKIVELP